MKQILLLTVICINIINGMDSASSSSCTANLVADSFCLQAEANGYVEFKNNDFDKNFYHEAVSFLIPRINYPMPSVIKK